MYAVEKKGPNYRSLKFYKDFYKIFQAKANLSKWEKKIFSSRILKKADKTDANQIVESVDAANWVSWSNWNYWLIIFLQDA